MPRFGYHFDPPLATIPYRLSARNSATFQTTLRDPMRLSKVDIPDEADQEAYRVAATSIQGTVGAGEDGALWGMVHASLITNIASPDARIRHGSISALVGDANLAASLGLAGVCFHGGYQKGHDTRAAALDALAAKLTDVLAKLKPGASVWLENGCEGTELGQTIAELGQVVQTVQPDPAKFGLVLDTCHLHVAGFDLAAPDAPQRLADEINIAGLTPYLRALHLNDAREACGSHRDRHAVPGDGTIAEGLRHLCRHPLFAPLPPSSNSARKTQRVESLTCKSKEEEIGRRGDKETRRQCLGAIHVVLSPCLPISLSPCLLSSLSALFPILRKCGVPVRRRRA